MQNRNAYKKIRSSLLLVLAAVIWGATFVAQSSAMDHIEPFTFNSIRFLIGAIVLLPFIPELRRKRDTNKQTEILPLPAGKSRTWLIVGSMLCGAALFTASSLQQTGIALGDSIGKAGFITSLYIILVPILGIFFKKRAGYLVWISAAIALVGMYLLCVKQGFALEVSDILYLLCAFFFAIHILLISVYAPYLSSCALSAIQFATAAVLSGICMFIFETPDIHAILVAYKPLLYAGIFACGIAYTLQVVGQRDLDPTIASLIMCLESVVSVVSGALILHQTMTARELIGCIVMLIATVLALLPTKEIKKPHKNA